MVVTNLQQRLITAFVLLPVVLCVAWFDRPILWLTPAVVAWGVLALVEFLGLVKANDSRIKPLVVIGVIWTAALIISPHFSSHISQFNVFAIGAVAGLGSLLFKKDKAHAFLSWAWTTAGVIWTGFFLSYLITLRLLPDGAGWLILAFCATFVSDTMAFFVGSLIGKRRLAPSISPSKTWEGAAGGFLGAIVISVLAVLIFKLPIGWVEAVILGALVSVVGQCGDLVESIFKRNMNTKDSGKSVPGHGGYLDRMDSVVFAVIVVYYYVVWLV